MQIAKWLGLVDRNAGELRRLISRYHPASRAVGIKTPSVISAPAAEAACVAIRQEIAAKPQEPPVKRFDEALLRRDCKVIANLLSEAWFGVPESYAAWTIPGFAALCDLCDDLPDLPIDGNEVV